MNSKTNTQTNTPSILSKSAKDGDEYTKDIKNTTTTEIENVKPLHEPLTETSLKSNTESGTQEIAMWKQENKMLEGKSENPIVQYEPVSHYFQKELLESTSVLNESTQLLHKQTKLLLQNPESEVRKVDMYNVEQARQNMNTIAKLIQTKINFIKVMR